MPSFLNKVFGYKKHDDKETARPSREPSESALLDGKYEAIAPVLSPSAATFSEAQQSKDSDRDTGFSLFKPRIRGIAQKTAQKHSEDVPHLTLQLPALKANRTLSIVFEADPDSKTLLDDAVIAAKRLNPLEALILIRACTRAITERGLETLGIMHPHWLSASPDVQRRLISLFIRSLTQSPTTTLSPTSTSPSPASAFENELQYTRSPHDVAAVLRWGLRHLSLENGYFGKDSAEMGWYDAFFQAERNASYPFKGFSELLVPQLPASHLELLTVTLSLISSLASHAEANSISGSKLSKFLGLWLLVATRAEESDDWNRFYARWERCGRILEHLFLTRLREESSVQRLPTRLQELVKHYPYNKGSPDTDDGLLSRPRFSTRQYDALFVRVESLLFRGVAQPKQHPIQLLFEAFQLPIDNPSANEYMAFWNTLKATAFEEGTSSDSEGPQFSRIFVDETIHLLSLIPADNNYSSSPALLTSPITRSIPRKRSSSLTKAPEPPTSKSGAHNGSTPVSPPLSPASPSSIVVTDWAQFTLSGFGDTSTTQPLSALSSQDDDVEVTQPRVSPKSSPRDNKSRTHGRRSEEREPLDTPPSSRPDLESIVETKLASVHMVQIDEAFIDFWSDAIVDPISANWPTFVVCGLKQIQGTEQPIRWLVIEQSYARQEPSRAPSPDGRRGRSPRPSFKSDISGFRINSVFSTARKRLSMFSKSATDLDLKKSAGKAPAAGELGEILVEEEPPLSSTPLAKTGLHVDENATVIGEATADVPGKLKTGEVSNMPILAVPTVLALKADPTQAAVEELPNEPPIPQSISGGSDSSIVPHPSDTSSEETISVERGSPRAPDVVHPKVDVIAPLMADTRHSLSAADTHHPQVISGPASSEEKPVAEEVHIQGEDDGQRAPVEAENQLVTRTADRDERLHSEATAVQSGVVQTDIAGDGAREAVAIPPILETVVPLAAALAVLPVVVAAVGDNTPGSTVEEPHVSRQPLQEAPADAVAALTVESVGRHEIDDLASLSSTEIIATETGAQLEPLSMASVADEEAQEITEYTEIPTPAPEPVTLVEEGPGREASVDVCRHAWDASRPEVPDGAAPQVVAFHDAASQPVAAELLTVQADGPLVALPVEAPAVEVIGTSTQLATETTDRVSEHPAEEAQSYVQDNVGQAAEVTLVEAPLAPEAESDASASTVSTSQAKDVAPAEVEAQAAPANFAHEVLIVETQATATPLPLPEYAVSADETFDPVIPADTHVLLEATPAITPEAEVEANTQNTVVEVVVEAEATPTVYTPLADKALPSSGAELSPQVKPGSNLEATTTALATQDEAIAVKAETQLAPDAPTRDAEVHTSDAESALVEETLEVAAETSEPVPNTALEPKTVEHKPSEPVAEEAQVLVDEVPIASEPVAITPIVPVPIVLVEEPVIAQDARAPEPPAASASQIVDDDDAADPSPVVTVPEETVTVQVEELEELLVPEVAPLTEDTEPTVAPPEHGPPVVVTQVVVVACEPETPTTKLEPVVVSVAAPAAEDPPITVGAEESVPVAVQATHEAVTSKPEIDETTKVHQPQKEVDLAKPVTSESSVSSHAPILSSKDIASAKP